MNKLPLQGRTLALLAVIIPLLGLFIYVGLRSGPLAPVAVTVATVESRAITPALFGIGTVVARYTYKIGPTSAGRGPRCTLAHTVSVIVGMAALCASVQTRRRRTRILASRYPGMLSMGHAPAERPVPCSFLSNAPRSKYVKARTTCFVKPRTSRISSSPPPMVPSAT